MASASLSGFSMTGWTAQSFRPQLPLPPVVYPPCFGKGCTFTYFFHSKILALSFFILGIAFFVEFICAFLPFWFILRFNIADSTFGSEGDQMVTKDTGIFFYTNDEYASLLFLEKMSNRKVVPVLYTKAQVWEVISVAIVGCAFVGAGILVFRKYASITGVIFLATLSTFAAVGQILMVAFAVASLLSSTNDVCEVAQQGCKYTQNQVWRNLPFREQFYHIRLHSTPKMEGNWAFYVAIIGAILSIIGCITLWVEGLALCRTVRDIRYKQLREKRDVYEKERDPTDFIYSPPSRSQPPAYGAHHGVAYAPPRQTYRAPPSVSGASSQSGSAYVSREVDL